MQWEAEYFHRRSISLLLFAVKFPFAVRALTCYSLEIIKQRASLIQAYGSLYKQASPLLFHLNHAERFLGSFYTP
jgi:hypothetical protein